MNETGIQELGLNGEIKPLSEKMAQELADAFSKVNEDTKELGEAIHRMGINLIEAVRMEAAGRLVHVTAKFAEASFLTKWYWKRRYFKEKARFDKVENAADELARYLQEGKVCESQ